MPTTDEIKQEDKKLRYLKLMVDFNMAVIAQTHMPIEEAHKIVSSVKEFAVRLFPEKGEVFDMVYGARFKRLINEKYGLH
ncbi:MAG: hypothetical protein A2X87_00860 [Deltaproteobacteria bacterium GWC2_42_51]|nr:MAG: hypothetical protein A2067_00800 [Deltaproteobacteria bacterium GWB2_42_7]OGP34261.1 MAG: hypothetical protein A2X87_00860 [Deltaproteobacteria bacterium GWC2_42_51]OGP44633.1 MAG: hypothetical protein A2090_04860 [Deltaproteobacteria bacterium GWD2_42_10]OGP47890.1 MAG: hypothetical protein A2022_05650 [Deltaproteobacteria bacterium GWF2_42_12]OGQ25994.1 MAG: hypothetical protein A3D29_07070 [Deltaproteobacteria bacterium RIFCSPHIGHO2_02_FULL_42_44]OGQ35596.1 MAG: hypothetical protein